MVRGLLAGVIGVVVSGTVLAAQAPDPVKVAAGQKLYAAQNCSECHQIKGAGGKLSTPLDGVSTKLSAADLKMWLTDPVAMEAKLPKKPVMPMSTYMKTHKLTDPDADALVAYLQSLK
jgi:mono/diheme cytochrome c family protein